MGKERGGRNTEGRAQMQGKRTQGRKRRGKSEREKGRDLEGLLDVKSDRKEDLSAKNNPDLSYSFRAAVCRAVALCVCSEARSKKKKRGAGAGCEPRQSRATPGGCPPAWAETRRRRGKGRQGKGRGGEVGEDTARQDQARRIRPDPVHGAELGAGSVPGGRAAAEAKCVLE